MSTELALGLTTELRPNVRILLLVALRFRDSINEEIIKA